MAQGELLEIHWQVLHFFVQNLIAETRVKFMSGAVLIFFSLLALNILF